MEMANIQGIQYHSMQKPPMRLKLPLNLFFCYMEQIYSDRATIPPTLMFPW